MVLMTVSLKSESSKIPMVAKVALLFPTKDQLADPVIDLNKKFQCGCNNRKWEGGKGEELPIYLNFCVASSSFNVECSSGID